LSGNLVFHENWLGYDHTVGRCENSYMYLPYLLADLGEIWYRVSSHDASE